MCKGKAQNRIEYIVYHNPKEAAELIEKNGYVAPEENEELARAVKLLVKKKGEKFISELIKIHPDKNALLNATGHISEESNYCGCNSSFNEGIKDTLNQLSGMSTEELTELYEEAKIKSKENPENRNLMNRAESIWDELGRKRKKEKEETIKKVEADNNHWLQLGIAFLIGIVIAKIA